MQNNVLTFAFCPHCSERDIKQWENIVSFISSILKKEVNIVLFKDFVEEEKITEFDYHIVYANPDTSLKLWEKGYILLGKLKNDINSLCSITSLSYSSKKELINIALINSKYFLIPLLLYKKKYKNFHLIFAKNYEEIIDLVKKGIADFGFIYTSNLRELEDEKNIKFSEDFCFPCPHFIFIHPSLREYKEKLLNIEDIDKASEEEIQYIKSLYEQLEILLEEWAYHDITKALMKSSTIGMFIYQEKIVFINEYALNLLGYEEEEILEMNSIDLVYKEDKEKVIENLKRRLSGKNFSSIYDIRFVKKGGEIIHVKCFTSTILFKGRYSGCVIFYDITQQKHAESVKEILKEINKIITMSLTEEEIYSGICKALVENLKFKFVWIGLIDEYGKRIPKFHYGDNEFIKFLSELEHKCDKLLQEKKILINSDLRKDTDKNPIRLELLKRGVLSSCVIPLFKNKKIVSSISIYSEFPNYFTESIADILQEIQRNLSFALERVERIRHNTIISEAIKNSDTWILVTDEEGNITYVNESVEKISGYKKEELIGQNPRIFKSGLNPPEFYKEMWDTILSDKIFNAITPNRKKSGEIFHVDLKIIPIRLPGNILRFVAVAKDITEKLVLSERINKLQNYDALTGLLNLNGFSADVSVKLRETQAKGLIGVFLLIDLCNMTGINKILGFSGGDRFLQSFAKNLSENFKGTDAVARISADTFGVYVMIDSSIESYSVYQKILELNDFKFEIENKTVSTNINAGIALFPKDGTTFKSLYEKADITLTEAKNEGEGVIKFYDPAIEKDVESQWEIINLVRKALDENLFVFHYQPYYHTDTLKVAGFEALVRIIDKDKIYYPNSFINYIENSQYLNKFEDFLIKETIEKIRKWRINISINISGKTFNDANFIQKISRIPEEIRDKVTIEITERVFIENPDHVMDLISMIKKMKNPPKIAMDDFGTGFSSLVYLKDLPIDIIKIDIAFIRDILKDKKSFAVVQTIIELAKRLDKLTLAEGVEKEEQLNILKFLGCDLVQGFLLSKPLSIDIIESNIIK
ncbi:MAG: EAL domain-containing protein [Thermodesulfovibrio sp.]|nr:EAL domain-containing protein [Thermodesulfovibrio sp.]